MTALNSLILGIDLGGTDTKFGIVDAAGKVLRRAKFPTDNSAGPARALEIIAAHAREVIAGDPVAAVGMGVPGPMSSRLGIVFEAPNLPGWIETPVRDILEGHLGLPVTLNNDANAAAFGEYWTGAGRGAETMILFTLGTGIGGGIVLGGTLYTGPDDTAGELGHMCIDPDGPLCGCGRRGCLEAFASATGIRRYVRERLDAGATTSLHIPDGDWDTFGTKLLYDAALAGDAFSREVFEYAAMMLGIGAANVINIFNPDRVVYGGAMANAGDLLFEPLIRTARARAFERPASRALICPAQLGEDAGLVGAAGLALRAPRATPAGPAK